VTISKYLTVPNALSASRVVFLPLLYFLALRGHLVTFTLVYAILGATDYFDGVAARRLNQKTAFGKVLDSFADLPFYLSTAYFIWLLYADYLRPNLTLLYVFFGFLASSLIVSGIKCGKPMLMHTFLLKLVAVLVYALVILSYFLNTTIFITVIISIYILGFVESILIFLIYGEVDPDSPFIFKIRPKK
jgi:phosphatidylglycerophosphate synthase